MKKIQKLLVITLALFMFNVANALEIVDVKSDYWAGQEIVHSIQNGYIYVVDGNKFKPENPMPRNEFVTGLMKVISRNNEPIEDKTSFKDVNNTTPNKRSIMISEQIKIAFGYPDSTFKPAQDITHNEVMALIANITNGDFSAYDITNFKDYKDIPLWARRAYIKNVANDIYVNHPDALKFTPNAKLTRAEAAVYFDKIANNLDKVKNEYKDVFEKTPMVEDDTDYSDVDDNLGNQSQFLGDQTLGLVNFATNNRVKIYDNKKIIEAGNIIVGVDMDPVKTRKDLVGHTYVYTAPNDVYTKEGTFLYPKGTEFYARCMKIGYSAWRSKPERSTLVFYKYSLPNGESYDMAGVPFTRKGEDVVYASANGGKSVKKALTVTNYKNAGKQYLIDTAHQMSPLTEFNIDRNKVIYILITGDTVFPQDSSYINHRTEPSLLEGVKM